MESTRQEKNIHADDQLVEYTRMVQGMQSSLQRIIANKKAISASLGRTALALRSMAARSPSAGPTQQL